MNAIHFQRVSFKNDYRSLSDKTIDGNERKAFSFQMLFNILKTVIFILINNVFYLK